jgi:protein-disulfide isomerase
MLSLVLLTTLLFPTSQFGGFCGCEDKPRLNVLAVVNGVKITKRELGSSAQNEVSLLQSEVVRAREAELERQINNLLLELEAKKRGMTSAQLLQLEVSSKVLDPTDAEAEEFYKERKQRLPQGFKSVKAGIISYLKTERERLEAVKFAQRLRAQNNVTIAVPTVTPPTNEAELDRVFADVNGHSITSRDIEESLLPLIFTVQERVYAIRKADLDLRINDLLLEQEAKKQNSTPDAILARAVRARLPIITDQEAKAFYNENRGRFQDNFNKVKFQIIQYLLAQEQQKLTNAFATELRQNAAVQIYLTPPESPTFRIATDNQPWRGNSKADVTVVQFTDFECLSCAKQFPEFERLMSEFGAQVKFVVRDFPLLQHKNAFRAAEAAEAAHEQGKYWEYISLLYENQSALQPQHLRAYASRLGLDRVRFDAALDGGKFKERIQRDIQDGVRLGINGSPVFFVNGKRVLDYSYAGLRAAIQVAIKRSG